MWSIDSQDAQSTECTSGDVHEWKMCTDPILSRQKVVIPQCENITFRQLLAI